MNPLKKRIGLLEYLGELLRDITSPSPAIFSRQASQLREMIVRIKLSNPWFTESSVVMALTEWGEKLRPAQIREWAASYKLPEPPSKCHEITSIMAGNIPLVGFHDFVSVVITGNRFTGKVSSKDNILFPLLRDWIIDYDNSWKDYINLITEIKKEPEVIIATGSNNTSRLLSQKYAGVPSLIRHNRNSAALLNGKETDANLRDLCRDILSYYGLGCRNVSLLMVPETYNPDRLINLIREYRLDMTEPYLNNLKYQKASLIMNEMQFHDAGKLLLVNIPYLNSPLGTVNIMEYRTKADASIFRTANRDNIQCSVGDPAFWDDVVPFGESQKPGLADYADGIDTVNFLISL